MSDVLPNTNPAESGPAKGFDPEVFSANLARTLESSGRALSAYLKPRQNGDTADQPGEFTEVITK